MHCCPLGTPRARHPDLLPTLAEHRAHRAPAQTPARGELPPPSSSPDALSAPTDGESWEQPGELRYLWSGIRGSAGCAREPGQDLHMSLGLKFRYCKFKRFSQSSNMNYQLPRFTAPYIPGRQDLEGKLFNGGDKNGIKTP